ncbi:MAG: SpoIIE family protein phosphatase, partial [Candidatus Riflebacteria bacterium]
MKKLTLLLAKLTYGLILPLYLLWFAFLSHYQNKLAEITDRYQEKMEESLDLLADFHSDASFFHALLQKNLRLADLHEEPFSALENRFVALRRAFPDSFRFIVWNADGQVNQKLSEEKSFQYVLKSMFQISREIFDHYNQIVPTDPGQIPAVQQKIKLLRGYFGQFLMPNLMLEFFKPSYSGKAITVSETIDKRKLWCYVGNNFSVAVFISANILKQRTGPRMLVHNFNRRSSDIRLAYMTAIDYRSAGLPRVAEEIARFKLEVRKFEENAVSFRKNEKYLLQFRQVSPELIVLAYLPVQGNLFDPGQRAGFLLAWILKWLMIIGFVFKVAFLRFREYSLSVQQKFMLLLFFANGLPALVLFSTGYEFFREKKAAMIEAQQQESIRILKEIDARYPKIRNSFAGRLNEFIDGKNRQYSSKVWSEMDIESLKDYAKKFEPTKMFLVDRDKKQKITYNSVKTGQDDEFLKNFIYRCLSFSTNNDLRRRGEAGKSTLEAMGSEDLLFLGFFTWLDRITLQNTGANQHWTYFKLVGDNSSYNSWGMFAATWKREDLLRTFVLNELKNYATSVSPRIVGIMEINSQIVMPDSFVTNARFKRLLFKSISRRLMFHENLEINGENFLLCAIAGSEISEGILVALYPRALIENEIFRFKLLLGFIALIILLVLFQLVRLFSARLLRPIEGLAGGIEELRRRNFRYRIDFSSDDELGRLTSAFNGTMEGLQDLALGTAVQESLLPDENFSDGRVKIFARSLFMTKMGGDYFDYFKTGPERLGIIFGDVAGHGIPAAIIMAMAKALVASASVSFRSPADLLEQANQVLLFLKEKKLRRMMTCQCLELNTSTGEFKIANAGHCYPVLIKADSRECSFVEVNGTPLGNKTRKPYDEISGCLEKG